MRVVAVHHRACGAETRVRLPGVLPVGVVRRVRCSNCDSYYSTGGVDELGVGGVGERVGAGRPRLSLPALSLPDLPSLDGVWDRLPSIDPDSRGWRLVSVPLTAAVVIVALLLIQGGGDNPEPAEQAGAQAAATPPPSGSGGGAEAAAKASKEAKLIRGSSFSLALPPGWERIEPEGGATFAAVSSDGAADATLWIERDPGLNLPTFIARSLDQLRALAGSAQVVDRVVAPTPEATIVRLAADAPAGQPGYEVTLRAAGPYRYYLATSVQPDAGAKATAGAELISGSFTPEAGGAR
ncbi:MAG: hypothetical protein ACRDK9_05835 [Solirubrobacterales bacterium]